jgi:hypothetical protein
VHASGVHSAHSLVAAPALAPGVLTHQSDAHFLIFKELAMPRTSQRPLWFLSFMREIFDRWWRGYACKAPGLGKRKDGCLTWKRNGCGPFVLLIYRR